ncbi:HAD superfamily hydrolase [Candidatus Mancarchaeum acidiphilum]|uniref:HAD superfamily hydrolase n=2 Tax=Candidatus Mancarchaeum acidiphilum TaxID=1920749 RepID=A0A218NN01_9ARCH|nr:HAD superfamily hydrolase [Candidatus Mancarchaeum acidiphilum]
MFMDGIGGLDLGYGNKKSINLVTDLNGTIGNGTLTGENADAFQRLVNRGINVIPATSYSLASAFETYFSRLSVKPNILIVERGNAIAVERGNANIISRFAKAGFRNERADEYGYIEYVFGDDNEELSRKVLDVSKELGISIGIAPMYGCSAAIKIMFDENKTSSRQLEDRMDKLGISMHRNGQGTATLVDDRFNKWTSYLELVSKGIIDDGFLIGIGNDLNDVQLLNHSDISILVGRKINPSRLAKEASYKFEGPWEWHKVESIIERLLHNK